MRVCSFACLGVCFHSQSDKRASERANPARHDQVRAGSGLVQSWTRPDLFFFSSLCFRGRLVLNQSNDQTCSSPLLHRMHSIHLIFIYRPRSHELPTTSPRALHSHRPLTTHPSDQAVGAWIIKDSAITLTRFCSSLVPSCGEDDSARSRAPRPMDGWTRVVSSINARYSLLSITIKSHPDMETCCIIILVSACGCSCVFAQLAIFHLLRIGNRLTLLRS